MARRVKKEKFPITCPKDYDPVFQSPNHPRVGVSCFEATAFCRWLNERLNAALNSRSRREEALTPEKDGASLPRLLPGEEVRLPSEAEWERAARGPKGRRYPWGDESLTGHRCNWKEAGIGHTSAVGMFSTGDTPPEAGNTQGVADLAGNVWEWCRTLWLPDYQDYEKKEQNASDDLESESARVLRGGSWIDFDPDNLVSSYRNPNTPGNRNYNVGFRVVRVGASAR